MLYNSTRGQAANASSMQAIINGMAADGGLFVPETIPQVNAAWIQDLLPLSYQQRAVQILRLYLDDYSEQELAACVQAAYRGNFDVPSIAPVVSPGKDEYILELWHGPTAAFKDMALQLLPQLLSSALQQSRYSAEMVILVATSGDTGKAALEGFKDVGQTRIIVFFPQDGVSNIQRLQMVTQDGQNVAVVGVKGNFDDAQNGVKAIFNSEKTAAELASRGFQLSSANSINWGRLVPQIVYYFSAYADMIRQGKIVSGQLVNFAVPTGNFGNILAGYYAKAMGLPIQRLICASNANNVLTDFLASGCYDRNRIFHKTLSPSMDILISSNLERLLYHITGSTAQVSQWMGQLNNDGRYCIGQQYLSVIKQTFWAGWCSDDETLGTIRRIYNSCGYVADPHTAVAWQVADNYRTQTGDMTPTIIVSTASPFKFNESVLTAIGDKDKVKKMNEFESLQALADFTGWQAPQALTGLAFKEVRHQQICEKNELANVIKQVLDKI